MLCLSTHAEIVKFCQSSSRGKTRDEKFPFDGSVISRWLKTEFSRCNPRTIIPSGWKPATSSITVSHQSTKLWAGDILAALIINNWKPSLFALQEWHFSWLFCFRQEVNKKCPIHMKLKVVSFFKGKDWAIYFEKSGSGFSSITDLDKI